MKNEVQHILSNYEAVPPSHMWAEIEAALEHQMAPHAEVLYRYQQTPPTATWNKIEHALHLTDKNDQKVVPLYTRKSSFIRYAAAAAVLILIASAITLMVTRNQNSNEIADQPVPVISKDSNNTFTEPGNKEEPTVQVTESKTTRVQPDPVIVDKNVTKKNKVSGRYLTMADEKGKKVRLSKKVASVFDCADNTASVKSIGCKESIESLQQKMSASLLSASGDFSGLIDMIKSLEENN